MSVSIISIVRAFAVQRNNHSNADTRQNRIRTVFVTVWLLALLIGGVLHSAFNMTYLWVFFTHFAFLALTHVFDDRLEVTNTTPCERTYIPTDTLTFTGYFFFVVLGALIAGNFTHAEPRTSASIIAAMLSPDKSYILFGLTILNIVSTLASLVAFDASQVQAASSSNLCHRLVRIGWKWYLVSFHTFALSLMVVLTCVSQFAFAVYVLTYWFMCLSFYFVRVDSARSPA